MQMVVEAQPRCDDLPLLLVAAVHHPDRQIRLGVRRALAEWAESVEPTYTAKDVDAILTAQHGTVLEPFVLNRRDRWMAVLLARVAFSKQLARTRFRVVSRETIGEDGGLMLTRNLQCFYIERFAHGYRRHSSEHIGFVAPRSMPSRAWVRNRRRCRAEVSVDDESIQLRIGPFDWTSEMGVEPYRLERLLGEHSTLEGAASLQLSRVFRVAHQGMYIHAETLGGESILQLGAHMAQGSTLVLSAVADEPRARVFIRLQPLQAEKMQLACVASASSGTLPRWVHVDADTGPNLSDEIKIAVARWFRPLESWIEPNLMEALL